MIQLTVYVFAAMLGWFSSPVLAEGGAYQIELIVFLQSMPNTEVFDQASSQINWPSDLTELGSYNKPEKTSLDDSYTALAKDPAYRPILHVAWIQPPVEKGLSSPVHIQGADGKLNGYLQIQHDQGLQMTVDLELASHSGDGFKKNEIYRLNEKRSMKLNEVYYLDHPKFGVIAKISSL
ncbi:MAG: CsiV family protein [Methylobacter sp.]